MHAHSLLHPARLTCAFARTSVLLAAVGFAAPAEAQSRQLWYRTHDGSAHAEDVARDVAVGLQGETYAIGSSDGAGGTSDVLVLAYDAAGQLRWERRIDLGADDHGIRILFDAASGALFALGTRSALAGSDVTSFAWRLDPASGGTSWERMLPSTPLSSTFGRTLAVDASGALLVGAYTSTASSQLTALIARYESNGTPSWTWSGSSGYVAALAPEPGGDLFVQTVGTGSVRRFFRLDSSAATVWTRDVGSTDLGCFGPVLDANANVHFSINEGVVNGKRIEKLDSAGNTLWSVTAASLFGSNASTYGLTVDAQGNTYVVSSNQRLARLDPNGNVVWNVATPGSQWFDIGQSSGLTLAPNGNVVLRMGGHLPYTPFLDYDAIVCFDSAGTFLWSQAIRGLDPATEIETFGLVATRQGAVVVAGLARTAGSVDAVVAAIRPQSSTFCHGDGSSGPCPCGNESTPGYASGCLRTGTFVGVRLDDQGIASLGSDSLRFFANGVAPVGVCALIQGQPSANATPFQDGLLCLTGSLVRLHLGPAAGAYLDLPASGAPSIHAISASLGAPIAPGTTRGYQVYCRGGMGMCSPTNGNLSNGVRVAWEL